MRPAVCGVAASHRLQRAVGVVDGGGGLQAAAWLLQREPVQRHATAGLHQRRPTYATSPSSRPERSFRLRSLPYSRLICSIVWASALLLSVPTFYFYNWYEPSHTLEAFMDEDENTDTPHSPQYVCEFRFMDNATAWKTKVAVPSTQLAVGFFFLPLLIMVFCYTAVIASPC
ncbi:hypothetical protein L3Q82_001578 [Scortum barcoo]|uniref:Uncharacterized protein n=1 Tax=Scortum barcoo TaxID=214431 RepID=A0ACB8W8C6_9TELE|nr:hypothetical protein L3Q82_001578 [Scortum barcoo]